MLCWDVTQRFYRFVQGYRSETKSKLENYRDDTFPKTSKVEKNESVKKGIKSFVKR